MFSPPLLFLLPYLILPASSMTLRLPHLPLSPTLPTSLPSPPPPLLPLFLPISGKKSVPSRSCSQLVVLLRGHILTDFINSSEVISSQTSLTSQRSYPYRLRKLLRGRILTDFINSWFLRSIVCSSALKLLGSGS